MILMILNDSNIYVAIEKLYIKKDSMDSEKSYRWLGFLKNLIEKGYKLDTLENGEQMLQAIMSSKFEKNY